MITSSNFFEKSFLNMEQLEEKLNTEDIGPWARVNSNYHSPGVQELSRKASKKYIDRKLRKNSLLNSRQRLPNLPPKQRYFSICQEQSPTLSTKRSTLFPQLSLNQYRQLYAKGNSIPEEEILARKQSRRKSTFLHKEHRITTKPTITSQQVIAFRGLPFNKGNKFTALLE